MDVTGGALVKATLHGPLHHPENLTVRSGDVSLRTWDFVYPMCHFPLKRSTAGSVISKDQLHVLKDFRANEGKSGLVERDSCQREDPSIEDMVIQANVKTADLKDMATRTLPDPFQGSIQLNGEGAGELMLRIFDYKRISTPCKSKSRLSSINLRACRPPSNARNISRPEDHHSLERQNSPSPTWPSQEKGRFDMGDPFQIEASLESAPISLASLPEDVLFEIKKVSIGGPEPWLSMLKVKG